MSLIANWWTEILAGLAIIAAFASAYFGGKKIGSTEAQAKADVNAEKVESQKMADVAKKQSYSAEVAKSVQTENGNLADPDARNKLRNSQFNSPD